MPVNVTVVEDKAAVASQTYPLLARCIQTKELVYFCSETTGVKLKDEKGIGLYPVGLFYNDWQSCLDKRTWEILTPNVKVELSNEA